MGGCRVDGHWLWRRRLGLVGHWIGTTFRATRRAKRYPDAARRRPSANWRGTPLTTYETIVDRIGNTRTAEGLRVKAEIDDRHYPTGVTVTKEQMNAMALVPEEFHGEWNYKLKPR